MTALKDRFWAKVVFKEFIRHYRKMTAEQKAADIDASMDALEDLDDTGNSFGAKMVRWSMDRVDQYPMAQENGKKGGRPRKDSSTSEGARESEQRTEANSGKGIKSAQAAPSHKDAAASVRMPAPRDKHEVMDFAEDNGLDVEDARLWYQRNYVERPGCDKDGEVIRNWRGALINACKAEETKRRTA